MRPIALALGILCLCPSVLAAEEKREGDSAGNGTEITVLIPIKEIEPGALSAAARNYREIAGMKIQSGKLAEI
jgi:hypothetical protein